MIPYCNSGVLIDLVQISVDIMNIIQQQLRYLLLLLLYHRDIRRQLLKQALIRGSGNIQLLQHILRILSDLIERPERIMIELIPEDRHLHHLPDLF